MKATSLAGHSCQLLRGLVLLTGIWLACVLSMALAIGVLWAAVAWLLGYI